MGSALKLVVVAFLFTLGIGLAFSLWMAGLTWGFGPGYRNPVFDYVVLALTTVFYGIVGLWAVTVAVGVPLALKFRGEAYLTWQWPLWIQPPLFLLGVYLCFSSLAEGFALEQLAAGTALFWVGHCVMIYSSYRRMGEKVGLSILVLPVLLILHYPRMLWNSLKIWRGERERREEGKTERRGALVPAGENTWGDTLK
jgi:membrane-bound ClpP family serine protease